MTNDLYALDAPDCPERIERITRTPSQLKLDDADRGNRIERITRTPTCPISIRANPYTSELQKVSEQIQSG